MTVTTSSLLNSTNKTISQENECEMNESKEQISSNSDVKNDDETALVDMDEINDDIDDNMRCVFDCILEIYISLYFCIQFCIEFGLAKLQ